MGVRNPTSLDDALSALADGSTRVLAGGTDLMVAVNAGRGALDSVVSVCAIPELRTWHHDGATGIVRIGAAVTVSEMASGPLATLLPALAQAAAGFGSVQIRNAATIGGAIGTSAPSSDLLVVLAALDALVELASVAGWRRLPLGDLLLGTLRNGLRPDELVVAVEVRAAGPRQHFAKVGARNSATVATVNAAVVLDVDRRTTRVALGAVAPTVRRAPGAERWLSDRLDWTRAPLLPDRAWPDTARRFGALAAAVADPIDDQRASAAYRRRAAMVLCARLAQRCWA